MDGVSVAFSTYAIAAVISLATAGLMSIIVKAIEASNRRNLKKK